MTAVLAERLAVARELADALLRAQLMGLTVVLAEVIEVACPSCDATLTLPPAPYSAALAARRIDLFAYRHGSGAEPDPFHLPKRDTT